MYNSSNLLLFLQLCRKGSSFSGFFFSMASVQPFDDVPSGKQKTALSREVGFYKDGGWVKCEQTILLHLHEQLVAEQTAGQL